MGKEEKRTKRVYIQENRARGTTAKRKRRTLVRVYPGRRVHTSEPNVQCAKRKKQGRDASEGKNQRRRWGKKGLWGGRSLGKGERDQVRLHCWVKLSPHMEKKRGQLCRNQTLQNWEGHQPLESERGEGYPVMGKKMPKG